jgi:prevent-host-death family protein
MFKLPTSDAREQLAELVNRAAFGNERIVLTRHGKDIAVLVSVDDLARLQALDAVSPRPPRGRRKALTAEERKAVSTRIQATMRAIQEQASSQGVDDVSDDEIAAEVEASRKARRR